MFVTESKILPDADTARIERVNQESLDELLGGKLPELFVEILNQEDVHPRPADELRLLIQRGNRDRRPLRRNPAEWMGIKGDDHGLGAKRLGSFADSGENGPVPPVDAIKIADRDDTRSRGRHIGQALNNVHRHLVHARRNRLREPTPGQAAIITNFPGQARPRPWRIRAKRVERSKV